MNVRKLLFKTVNKITHRNDMTLLFNGNVGGGGTYTISGKFSDYDFLVFTTKLVSDQFVFPPITMPIKFFEIGIQTPVYVASMGIYGYVYLTVMRISDTQFRVVQSSAGGLGISMNCWVYGIVGGVLLKEVIQSVFRQGVGLC